MTQVRYNFTGNRLGDWLISKMVAATVENIEQPEGTRQADTSIWCTMFEGDVNVEIKLGFGLYDAIDGEGNWLSSRAGLFVDMTIHQDGQRKAASWRPLIGHVSDMRQAYLEQLMVDEAFASLNKSWSGRKTFERADLGGYGHITLVNHAKSL